MEFIFYIIGVILIVYKSAKELLYKKRKRNPGYKKKNYNKYLRSKHWKEKRQYKMKQSKYTCERCGKVDAVTKRFQIHHKHYKTLGKEKMSDLMCLCPNCHRKIHGKRR
jgi:5-methylcytosine-specific restriction endonuclease McrA